MTDTSLLDFTNFCVGSELPEIKRLARFADADEDVCLVEGRFMHFPSAPPRRDRFGLRTGALPARDELAVGRMVDSHAPEASLS